MKNKTSSFLDLAKKIEHWIHSLITRFPRQFDHLLYQRFHAFLGAIDPLLLKHRSLNHIKRLLITQYFLEKKNNKKDTQPFHLRLFAQHSHLYLSIITSVDQKIPEDLLLDHLGSLTSTLIQQKHLTYQWTSQNPPQHYLHLAIKKMRDPYLPITEIKKIEKELIQKLQNNHTHPTPDTFWPYNHEEGYRQLLCLRKEINTKNDLPQIWIQLHNQTNHQITFIIYLVEPHHPDKTPSLETIKHHIPPQHHLNCLLHQKIQGKILVQATILSLSIPSTQQNINILNTRERITQQLTHIIGPFRDFNGGLLETQKKQFSQLTKQLSHKIPHFNLYSQPLFYNINPIEKQLSLNNQTLKELFQLFSHHLQTKQPTSKTDHILILTPKTPTQTSSIISKCRTLQRKEKITAYAHLKINQKEYLCIIDETAQFLPFSKPPFFPTQTRPQPLTLRLAFKGDALPSYSPYYLAQDTRGRTLAHLLFEGLFRTDSRGQVVPAAAETTNISEDQKHYTFKIRPNHWSNGEIVTAFQYEKAWKTHKEIPFFEDLTMHALDADTLQVNLAYPDPFFLEKLTYPIFFSIPHQQEPSHFNGPYLIREKKQKELILEKNPFYWDFKNIYFNEIKIRFERSSNKTLSLFKKGEIDWMGDPLSFNPPDSHPHITNTLPWSRRFFIHFNTKEPFFSSSLIRKAFNIVVDRKWICENLFKNSTPMFNFFDQSSDSISHGFTDANLKQGKRFFLKGLQKLGFSRNHLPVLTFIHPEGQDLEELANYLKKVWENAFGISIYLRKRPWNKFLQKLDQGEFHIAGLFRSVYFSDTLAFFKTFSGNYRNFSQWSHSCYNRVLMSAKQKVSKRSLLEELDKILIEEMPAFPLFKTSYQYITSPCLKNYTITPFGSLDFRFAFFEKMPILKKINRFLKQAKRKKSQVMKMPISHLESALIQPALRKQKPFFPSIERKKENRFYQVVSCKVDSNEKDLIFD